MSQLTLTLLGGFQARFVAGTPLVLPTKKAQALLSYLAVKPGQTHPRDKLAALLWGETGEEQARHSLRQTLVGLRKALSGAAPTSLLIEGDNLGINASSVEVDVVRFEKLAGEGTVESLEKAAALYQGDLLEGISLNEEGFEQWLITERERLWELALQSLAKLLGHYNQLGESDSAIQTAVRLLSLDPSQEAVHRILMRLYAQQGRREAALRQYQTCVRSLQRELGVEPDEETRQLYQDIMQQRPLQKSRAEVVTRTGAQQPAKESILVVEDEVVTRTLLEAYLTGAGYQVVLASDGADALYQLGRGRFDAILMDINMPNLDGLKLMEIMGQKAIDTPAIFLTALPGSELEAKGFELGAADFIRKPIQKEILLVRVKNVLAKSQRRNVEV